MSSAPTAPFLGLLAELNLLTTPQVEELRQTLGTRRVEPKDMARDLVRRGWLTPYQANQLVQGRGQELVLGGYVLLERLGEGGMGTVFKARHVKMKRMVAVKVIRKERLANADAVKRFYREVEAASQLSHPNIVLAFDAAEVNGTHFFAMEYVDGIDLAKLVKERGPLPAPEACAYIYQAALGLQHAHEQNLVHRDIKPANLLLAAQKPGFSEKPGFWPVVKVLDFGLARLSKPDDDSSALTREGSVMGTLDYIAPEQGMDSHTVDIRADLYSLGCTFYFLLTGKPPFPGGEALAKLMKHQSQPPQPVQQQRPDVPANIAAIVHKLLAKQPEDRFQTPAELAEVLEPLCAGVGGPAFRNPVSSRNRVSEEAAAPEAETVSPSAADAPVQGTLSGKRLRPPRSRKPFLLLAAAAVSVLFALCLGLGFWMVSKPPVVATVATRDTRPADPPREITNSLDMKLMLIPAGEFMMGSPAGEPGRQEHEGPQHKVVLSKPFHMGSREVTVGQFRTFVKESGYKIDGAWEKPGWVQTDNHPVVNVTWFDAVAFCEWLTKKEASGAASAPRRKYRLPTEAEWEYSCRAGTKTMHFFGNEAPTAYIWHNANAGSKTNPVGQLKPNAWDLHDMLGNAWEWTQDWYDKDYYKNSPKEDPQGPGAGATRVLRGGSWGSDLSDCRAAYRNGNNAPSYRRNNIGFRVVLVR